MLQSTATDNNQAVVCCLHVTRIHMLAVQCCSDGRLTGLTIKPRYFDLLIIILHHLLITRLLQYCRLSRLMITQPHVCILRWRKACLAYYWCARETPKAACGRILALWQQKTAK